MEKKIETEETVFRYGDIDIILLEVSAGFIFRCNGYNAATVYAGYGNLDFREDINGGSFLIGSTVEGDSEIEVKL